jgi:hypothetical protein
VRSSFAWTLPLAAALSLGGQGASASDRVVAVAGCGAVGPTLIHLPADPDSPREDRDGLACHAPCLAQPRRDKPVRP